MLKTLAVILSAASLLLTPLLCTAGVLRHACDCGEFDCSEGCGDGCEDGSCDEFSSDSSSCDGCEHDRCGLGDPGCPHDGCEHDRCGLGDPGCPHDGCGQDPCEAGGPVDRMQRDLETSSAAVVPTPVPDAMSSTILRILARVASPSPGHERWPGVPPGPGKNLPFFHSDIPLLS